MLLPLKYSLAALVFGLGPPAAPPATPPAATDTYPRQSGVTVDHYVFGLTLSDATDEVSGDATVSIRFTRDGLTTFFLDLASSANGKGMRVTAVLADSAPATFTHVDNRLTVTFARASRAGELRRFVIRYHGIPADGLRMGTNKYGERVFFSWNWPDKARQWLPMIDHPSAKATSEFVVTAPDRYSVVANGLLQSVVTLGDGRRVTHWKQSVPIASWLNAIGVEQFAVHYGGMVRGVELQTWVANRDLDAGIARYEPIARRALEFFSDYVGPYSYEKLANVAASFDRGGTEHASVIFYGDPGGTRSGESPAALAPAGRGGAGAGGGRGAAAGAAAPVAAVAPSSPGAGGALGGVVAHEIAHQWFGDAVTEGDWDDAWLSEGFATYFTLLYNEHYLGHDTFIAGIRAMHESAQRAANGLPLVHENIADLRGVIPPQVYQKGGSVLHMLRGQVGTDTFRAGIRDYYRRYQNRNASSDDFRRAFEETSGQDLKWFFAQWLHGKVNPAVEGGWRYDPVAKTITIDLAQAQGGSPYRLPIEVGIVSDSSATVRTEKVVLAEAGQRFVISSERAPKDVVLDPNSWLFLPGLKFVRR
jgi:aminopeptidase N